MEDIIDIPTYEQIEIILSQLITNYSNMAEVFYDIFYNQEAMDVDLYMYNEEGALQKYTIPNRAKDRAYILNGHGSPEADKSGARGSLYQDLDNGKVYIKETPDGNEGWSDIATTNSIKAMFIQGAGSPEGVVFAKRGVLYIDSLSATLYIKVTATGNTGWEVISASTEALAKRDLTNLTEEGEDHFLKKDLSNLNSAGQELFDAKEDITNKVTSISADSTDVEYPSAKCVFDMIEGSAATAANQDLSNLSDDGNFKFIDWGCISDCILSYTPLTEGATMLAKTGSSSFQFNPQATFLCANGITRDENDHIIDSKLAHKKSQPVSQIAGSVDGVGPANFTGTVLVFYNSNNNCIYVCDKDRYFESAEEPTFPTGGYRSVWYNPVDNYYRTGVSSYSDSLDSLMAAVRLGEAKVTNGNITELTSYSPFRIEDSRSVGTKVSSISAASTDNEYPTAKCVYELVGNIETLIDNL